MSSNQLKPLRFMLIAILVLLFFQYELGIQVNFSNLAAIPPFGFFIPQISDALHQAGSVALIHAIVGAWLVILAADQPDLIVEIQSEKCTGLWCIKFYKYDLCRRRRIVFCFIRFSE